MTFKGLSGNPSNFPPLFTENRYSAISDYFYLTLHYHNKTHAWQKDKLKETAQPKTWIWEAYFHLSFLSFILLCCSFLFAHRNGKRHAFSSSLCFIMVLFRSALLYVPSPEPCTDRGAAGGLPSLTSTCHLPLTQALPCQCYMLLISVAKESCYD